MPSNADANLPPQPGKNEQQKDIPNAFNGPTQRLAAPVKSQSNRQQHRIALRVVMVAVLVIVVAVGGVLILTTHRLQRTQSAPGPAGYTTAPKVKLGHPARNCMGGATIVPKGATVNVDEWKIKLLRTIANPSVSGPPPDPGTLYREFDLSLTTTPGQTELSSAIEYSPSIIPVYQTSCLEYVPIDTVGGSTDPYTGGNIAFGQSNRFKIPGKLSINSPDLESRLSTLPAHVYGGIQFVPGKTIDVYALFEVIKGDKGQLFWQSNTGTVYVFLSD